ncbi:MAG: hypothetical protein FWF79_10070 [Defluviitaleaceae bacterium]|nr:hypothetical protein [Defluviitaleaceae bacterium]
MKGKTYDLKKLAASGKFDISVSTRFYYQTQEYFDALTEFVNTFERDLSNYTPAFVMNCEEDRQNLVKECFEIRAYLVRMGVTSLIENLATIEDSAISGNIKEFADGQITLRANIKICKDSIKEATMRWKMSRPRR